VLDMTESIAPRSDQMNADDLMSGPRTFTIAEVRKSASPEQPVDVHLAEFPEGRPFKPSKSMRRVMVAAWGPDASTYTGRRMTLYRDPAVRFGGQDVGGIRISHMSHIAKPMTLALTVTRGKRAPYVVQPLADNAPAPAAKPAGPALVSAEQLAEVNAGLERLGITDREAKLAAVSQVVKRELGSARDLTGDEGAAVLAWIAAEEANAPADPDAWPAPAPIPGTEADR
jgi:hypothetical protein